MTLVLVLERVARFLYDHGPHVDLVPLLPVCTELGAWNTTCRISWITLCALWHATTALGVWGRARWCSWSGRADVPCECRDAATGRLLALAGVWNHVFERLCSGNQRGVSAYPTPRGYVHVEEMEALMADNVPWRAPRWYWCMHVMGHYTWGRRLRSRRPSPTRRTPKASDEPGWDNLDGARPSPPGIFCGRGLRKKRCATVSAELCGFPVIGARGQWQSQQRKS